MERATVAVAWLTVIPNFLNWATFSMEDFRNNLRIRFGLLPLELWQTCDGCGYKLAVDHDLQFNRGGLVTVRHKNVADEWDIICTAALTPSAISHKPLMNYGWRRTVIGGATSEADNEELYRQKEAKR